MSRIRTLILLLVTAIWTTAYEQPSSGEMDYDEGDCSADNITLNITGKYEVKPLCHRLEGKDLTGELVRRILNVSCTQEFCCEMTENVTGTCTGELLVVNIPMTVGCCCGTSQGDAASCEKLTKKVKRKLEKPRRFELKFAKDKKPVRLTRFHTRVTNSQLFCQKGFKPSADGSQCNECPVDRSSCRSPLDGTECSSHGNCICGRCDCSTGWFGRFCECKTGVCPKDSFGRVCSGTGVCIQGYTCPPCHCFSGWYGERCECSDYYCPWGKNGERCSGLGRCKCGQCQCDTDTFTIGLACDTCWRAEVNGTVPAGIRISGEAMSQSSDCFFVCSAKVTDRILVKFSKLLFGHGCKNVSSGECDNTTNSVSCKNGRVTISSGECDNTTNSVSFCRHDSFPSFYISSSNCLCILYYRDKGAYAMHLDFTPYDGRLSPIAEFLFETGLLDVYAQDDDGWLRLHLLLRYPFAASYSRFAKPLYNALPSKYQRLLKSID